MDRIRWEKHTGTGWENQPSGDNLSDQGKRTELVPLTSSLRKSHSLTQLTEAFPGELAHNSPPPPKNQRNWENTELPEKYLDQRKPMFRAIWAAENFSISHRTGWHTVAWSAGRIWPPACFCE